MFTRSSQDRSGASGRAPANAAAGRGISMSAAVKGTSPPVQLAGGLENTANYCFMNAVIQLVERSYADLFNPAKNVLPKERQPLQATIWQIIQDLGKDEQIVIGRVKALRAAFHDLKLVEDLGRQEDSQELLIKLIDYMTARSTNDYPYGAGNYRVQQTIHSTSEEADVVKEVPTGEQRKDPSNIQEDTNEFGDGLIGVDINIYHSFEDFLYYLYGTGTVTQLDASNYLRVVRDKKQVYVSARKEKRTFTLLPGVITFYIKRFLAGDKNVRDFPMPETLILVEEPKGQKKQYKKYALEAIVRHSGGTTLAGGHYYAVKKNKDGAWVKHNDEKLQAPSMDDPRQGSLYTYRMTEAKEALGDREAAPQETQSPSSKPPSTKGVILPPRRNAWDVGTGSGAKTGIKGGGFSPFVGTAPVASDKIRGLPNRSREAPGGKTVVVDCFINAVLQLVAGGYRDLFDERKNPVKNSGIQKVQAAVNTLIGKVNQVDTTPIGDGDIATLRQLLLEHRGVPSLHTQEDASELMQFLLGLMMDISGHSWKVPGKGDATAASVGRLAKAQGVSIEQLLRANPWMGANFIGISSKRAYRASDIVGARPPESFKGKSLVTAFGEEAEPTQGMIEVDIGQIGNFEEFLFQRYGKGWEQETFDKDYPRQDINVDASTTQSFAFKTRFKKYQFNHLPPVISFLIKRFKHHGAGGKEGKNYLLPAQLILVEQPQKSAKVYKHYELKGVVVHRGDSLEQGHYYTHRKEGRDWAKADDKSVWQEASPGTDMAQGVIYTYQLSGQSERLEPGQRAPQEKYDLPATIYLADSMLRPTDALGFAEPPKHRNTQSQGGVSGEINQLLFLFFPKAGGNFHAGHLFTSTLGGSGDARNLAPVWSNYNVGGYKKFEDDFLTPLVEKANAAGKRLYFHIHADYPADDAPETVLGGLVVEKDIQRLVDEYKTDESSQKDTRKRQMTLGVKNFYSRLIRLFRRVPRGMSAPEVATITVGDTKQYQNRDVHAAKAIAGSPRNTLGPLNWEGFLEGDEARVLQTDRYGPKKPIDLKGQDPDEWAIKTYKDMPEPGIYQYYNSDGKASGVDAYIWMDPEGIFSAYKFGGGTEDAGPAPLGFTWTLLNRATLKGNKAGLYVRGHLLNGKLHGSGNDPANLTPLTQETNKAMSRDFEEKIKKEPALTTPGRGIFWRSRLEGQLTRSETYREWMADLKAKAKPKDKEALAIALGNEEAKLFGRIHLFAYEATVKDNGKAEMGKLIYSASFANTFTVDGNVLDNTGYLSFFPTRFDRFMGLRDWNVKTELEAVHFLEGQIAQQDKNAAETYIKPSPLEGKQAPLTLEKAAGDIQVLLSEKLLGYYARYAKYVKWSGGYAKLRRKIRGHNATVNGFNRTNAFDKARYQELNAAGSALVERAKRFEDIMERYRSVARQYVPIKTLSDHYQSITGKEAGYFASKTKTLASLEEVEPAKPEKALQVAFPINRGQKRKKDEALGSQSDASSSSDDSDASGGSDGSDGSDDSDSLG